MTGPVAGVRGPQLAGAYRHCEALVRAHYENFIVGSWLMPRRLRQHLAALYAFVRGADDLADEGDVPVAERLRRLDGWQTALEEAYAGRASDPVFIAIADTVARFDIPIEPFRRLLDAFRADADWHGFATDADLLTYCTNTADPVGHLLLYLFRYSDAERRALSDKICTGLQLSNFWQDLGRDVARGRLYLPAETLRRHGGDPEAVARSEDGPALRRCLAGEVERARGLLLEGQVLATIVDPCLAREVAVFVGSGLTILGKIAAAGYSVMVTRPTVSRREKALVLLGAMRVRPRRPTSHAGVSDQTGAVRDAYAYCHQVTRRSGSSFAYAFRLLSSDRRAALEAVYAFCRFLDDAVDDGARGGDPDVVVARWRVELDCVYAGRPEHRIGVALADAMRRFALDRKHFDDLVAGVVMDLSQRSYPTFAELFRYCYRVASTVGLLCIEIFGYRNPSARTYATDLGIAFQLTNILRDVAEDARRGRIYLPLEDLAAFGVPESAVLAGRYSPQIGALMAFECGRARSYYLRARAALAPEDRGTLAAAEAMRLAYARLLDRIESRDFDVFARPVRLRPYEGVALALGAWGRAQLGARGA